jgi:hypothetical protein
MDRRHARMAWVKSSRCSNAGCVEVAVAGADHLVRDSKLMADSPILAFGAASWAQFMDAVVAGEFDPR